MIFLADIQTYKQMSGSRIFKRIQGIIPMMPVYCALLLLFIICIFIFTEQKPAFAEDSLTVSPRYHKCSDGIWRRPSDGINYVRSRIHSADLRPFIERSFGDPLYFLQSFYLPKHFRVSRNESFRKNKSDNTVQTLQSPNTSALCYFTGDIMCLRGQQYDASRKTGFDFWPSYRLVADFFNNADFVCGNLESLLSPSNPLTKDRKTDDDGTPLCNGPEELLRALKKAGFDMLVTANNHCCDYGAQGIIETKTNLDKYLFANTGTSYSPDSDQYSSASAGSRFCIFDVNGIKIAVLAYTHLVNQRSLMSAEELDTMVSCYDPDKVRNDISDAKAAGAEFIVVYCHWGIENTEELTNYEIKDSEYIAESGADLIIGSHPHCLQSCRFIETSDARSVFCIYSMGNFCSSMARDINNDTIILRTELERDQSGLIRVSVSYIPCHVTSYRSRSFVVVPIDPELNGGIKNGDLRDAGERIRSIMNDVIQEYK